MLNVALLAGASALLADAIAVALARRGRLTATSKPVFLVALAVAVTILFNPALMGSTKVLLQQGQLELSGVGTGIETIDGGGKITIDGKAAKLGDLKKGTFVLVTTDKNDKTLAIAIAASTKEKEK